MICTQIQRGCNITGRLMAYVRMCEDEFTEPGIECKSVYAFPGREYEVR